MGLQHVRPGIFAFPPARSVARPSHTRSGAPFPARLVFRFRPRSPTTIPAPSAGHVSSLFLSLSPALRLPSVSTWPPSPARSLSPSPPSSSQEPRPVSYVCPPFLLVVRPDTSIARGLDLLRTPASPERVEFRASQRTLAISRIMGSATRRTRHNAPM